MDKAHNIINFHEILVIAKHHRKFLIVSNLIFLACAFTVVLMMPHTFETKATILPDEGSMQRFGGAEQGVSMSNLGNVIGKGLLTPKNDTIVAILKSRNLARKVVQSQSLVPRLLNNDTINSQSEESSLQLATTKLLKKVRVSAKKTEGLIEISVKFSSPEISYAIIKAYLEELQEFIAQKTFTSAKRKRVFIENQLFMHKQEYLLNGKYFNSFYGKSSLMGSSGAFDVRIGKDSIFEKNKSDNQDSVLISNVPHQIYYDYLSKQLKISNDIASILAQQLEMAKIDEARDEIAFQIIDSPELLEKPNGLSKTFLFLGAMFSWVVISLFLTATVHSQRDRSDLSA